MRDRIRIEGIEFYGYHGVSAEEQSVGHRYWVDLTIWGDFRKAGVTDNIEDTVSYSHLARTVLEVTGKERFALLERLGEVIARAVLSYSERVEEVEVTVGKLHPPAKVLISKASVVLHRTREDLSRD